MMPLSRKLKSAALCLAACLIPLQPAAAEDGPWRERAMEVTDHTHKRFWDNKRDLYRAHPDKDQPDYIWGGGVMFSALVGAARHDKGYARIMRKYFDGLDSYWDDQVAIPGYEPAPTGGNGNDKYYDDNAWMVLTFLEAHEVTGESRYLRRANETLEFVLSGWDEELGGGIWWHECHKDGTKNTCANAPAAVGCLRMAKFSKPEEAERYVEKAMEIMEWTIRMFQAPDGLFSDSIKVKTREINHAKLTYNTALMLRAILGLHARTGNEIARQEADRVAKAADSLLDRDTGVYRDPLKWAHLMVEADIEYYRRTGETRALERARRNAEGHYEAWKKNPPDDLITAASLARELWLLADLETPEGREFWKESDKAE